MSETFEKISAVLDGEVQAGGKVELPKRMTDLDRFNEPLRDRWNDCHDVFMPIVTRLQAENAALQQRLNVADQQNDELKNAAPVCCVPTVEEKALLAAGDCTPEELWGGPRPTCHKCIGAPAPPAGAEVEVLGVREVMNALENAEAVHLLGTSKFCAVMAKHLNGSVSAHVTQLKAEKDALEKGWYRDESDNLRFWPEERSAIEDERDALQSDLTKARELLSRVYDADLAARHHQPYNVSKVIDDIESFLSHQSAPAAKDGAE